MAGPEQKVMLMCVVRGYHVYKDVWDPYPEEDFVTKHQRRNPHDKYAVAVMPVDAKSETIVGHLPREISKECCLFMYHGGTIMGVVKGRRRKTVEPFSGMEVPCKLVFRHAKKKILDKLKLCIAQKYQYRER